MLDREQRRPAGEQQHAAGKPNVATPVEGKTGYLKKDRQERFDGRRARWINAWRIVDENDNDLVQPWSRTKREARKNAKALGITLIERDAA